ncbi:Wall-associated receptor kinase - like 1 [Theobroma cacao]|nr:Wall-associated receptor kinase - like 1 [Theobroma cacao]
MTGTEPTIVGCESACIGSRLFGSNVTCNGDTCCEIVIASRLHLFNATFESKESESEGCKLAFLVEEQWLSFVCYSRRSVLCFAEYGLCSSFTLLGNSRSGF